MIHDDLLEIAAQLARLETRRPKQASLRRAVSTAYYALFHALAASCAEQLIGWSKPWAAFSPIYRSLDHAKAKKILQNAAAYGPNAALIGPVFIQLQERRHLADYDPEPFALGRSETLELIALAAEAVRAVREMPDEQALLLATHLVGKQR